MVQGSLKQPIILLSLSPIPFCSIYLSFLLRPLWLQCSYWPPFTLPASVSIFLPQSILLSIPLLPLHVSLHPTSVWGAGVDSKLACCQAYYAGLCGCTVLERTREANAGPLHHPHQHWLGSGRGSMNAHEWLARPGPYAFNTGTDVKHRPWTLTPLISLPLPYTLPQASHVVLGHAMWAAS